MAFDTGRPIDDAGKDSVAAPGFGNLLGHRTAVSEVGRRTSHRSRPLRIPVGGVPRHPCSVGPGGLDRFDDLLALRAARRSAVEVVRTHQPDLRYGSGG